VRATAAEETQPGTLVLLCLASWAIPGAGHLWLGRRAKGLIFLAALPVMFAIGLAIRYSSSSAEKEVEVKSPLANVDLSILSLPFLWPLFKSLRNKYEDSADAVKGGVQRLKKVDVDRYVKPLRKKWKAWAN